MSRREPDWLSVGDALRRILSLVHPLPGEAVDLADAAGRVLAQDVVSPLDQPPWDNSAMDGFAVRAADVESASADHPVLLDVVADVPAGAVPDTPIGPGQAARIMTGAPLPDGADTVVRIEHTDAWDAEPPGGLGMAGGPESPPGGDPGAVPGAVGGRVRVLRGDDAGRNVRRRGEDMRRGDVVLRRGRPIRPAEAGILAATGVVRPSVHRRPRVAILSNGDELLDPSRAGDAADGRGIVNSNAWSLAAAVRETGGVPVDLGIARDERASILRRLERVRSVDALITTAGASVGDRDLLKDVMEELGFRLAFWRVTMRPGSPFSFGLLPDPDAGGPARDEHGPGIPVFGLAGNPVSALVTFEVMVRPALRRMLGRGDVHARTLQVRLAEPFPSGRGLTHFLRARLEQREGEWQARLTGPQGSGILRSVAEADALVIVPRGLDGLPQGATAAAIRLDADDPAVAEYGIRDVAED